MHVQKNPPNKLENLQHPVNTGMKGSMHSSGFCSWVGGGVGVRVCEILNLSPLQPHILCYFFFLNREQTISTTEKTE